MSKKHKLSQKHQRHTTSGSSTDCTRQQPELTEEELDGIRKKLSSHTHNPLIWRLYTALRPN